MTTEREQFEVLPEEQQEVLRQMGVIRSPLEKYDGVMVAVFRADGSREITFPQLGRLTEGLIEQAQMDMYRGLMRARAEQAGSIVSSTLEDDDAA